MKHGAEYTASDRERAIARLAYAAGRDGLEWEDLLLQLAIVFGDPGAPEPVGILSGSDLVEQEERP